MELQKWGKLCVDCVRKDFLQKGNEQRTQSIVKRDKNVVAAMCQCQNSNIYGVLMCTEGTVRMGNYDVLIVAGTILKRKVVIVQTNC